MTAAASAPTPAIRVEGHVRLAHHYVRRRGLHRPGAGGAALDYDDHVSRALYGIWRAAQTFDPSRGAFSTYAMCWIRQCVGREIENHGATIRVPVHRQAQRRVRGEYPRAICESLDAPISRDGDGATKLDRLADDDAEPPDALAGRVDADRRRVLLELYEAARLSPRERLVVTARASGESYPRVGERIGVTRERARQIDAEALRRLRRAAERLGLEPGDLL